MHFTLLTCICCKNLMMYIKRKDAVDYRRNKICSIGLCAKWFAQNNELQWAVCFLGKDESNVDITEVLHQILILTLLLSFRYSLSIFKCFAFFVDVTC